MAPEKKSDGLRADEHIEEDEDADGEEKKTS